MFQEDFDDNFENTGVTAIALYDYQAAADDEISFDPNDVITNIEMVRGIVVVLVICLGMLLYWDYVYVLYWNCQQSATLQFLWKVMP